jgi:hypothetical protein
MPITESRMAAGVSGCRKYRAYIAAAARTEISALSRYFGATRHC